MLNRLLLLMIVLGYIVVGGLFATLTPAWQVPDEPAHYNYIAQLAADGCCPVITFGDWQAAYQAELTGARFAPALLDRLHTIQYEDHQPILYYLLMTPVYRLGGGDLTLIRLATMLMGVGVIVCAYGIGRALLPGRPGVALGAAAFIAFLPQHVAMLAGANNDGLLEALVAFALLLLVGYVRAGALSHPRALAALLLLTALVTAFALPLDAAGIVPVLAIALLIAAGGLIALGRRGETGMAAAWGLGALVGLIFITKTTGYFVAGLVPLAILLRHRLTGAPARAVLRDWALFLLAALLLGGIWWGRNLAVYGLPDFLGLGMHDAVVIGQPRTADGIAREGLSAYVARGAATTFNSFWGQFGWMALPLQGWMYDAFRALIVMALAGLIIGAVRQRAPIPPADRAAWALLLLAILLAAGAFLYYNTTYEQFQGRYLYPALIPLALLLALGLDGLARLIPHPALRYAALIPPLLLAPLDLYLITRVIAPLLAP